MGLNRSEQMLSDYVQGHPEERQFWQDKVRTVSRKHTDEHEAALRLDAELWSYYRERSAVAAPFRDAVARDGNGRVSMRGLAEYWIRLWAIPRPRPNGVAKEKNEGRSVKM